MIVLKRNGKTYTITEADQDRIRQLALANGGDLKQAMEQQFQEKFEEPMLVAESHVPQRP